MKTDVDTIGVDGSRERCETLPTGAMAGPWRVEGQLGSGGFGSVYAVVHEEIGKRAALKVMHRKLMTSTTYCDCIRLEARVVNQVAHPGIVDIFEIGALPDGRSYIVMERLDGLTLWQRANASKIQPDRVIAILLQLCAALTAAHAVGIIHRDLKLDNVFLVDDIEAPRVKLLDWSLAKVTTGMIQTTERFVAGTPHYLAPEQARGLPVSTQTDVYSLGVIAYALFLEALPFDGETVEEILAAHLNKAPPLPRLTWPGIPSGLEDLLLAMLAKQPHQRPHLAEVVRRLEQVRAEFSRRATAANAKVASRSPRRRARRWRYATGVLAAGITAASIAANLPATDPEAIASAAPRASSSKPAIPSDAPAAIPAGAASATTSVSDLVAFDPSEPAPHDPSEPETPQPPPPPSPLLPALRIASPKPTLASHAIATSPSTDADPAPIPTAAALVAQYMRVGRELQHLQDERGSEATRDLWPRYRLIQLNDALATDARRATASSTLTVLLGAASAR